MSQSEMRHEIAASQRGTACNAPSFEERNKALLAPFALDPRRWLERCVRHHLLAADVSNVVLSRERFQVSFLNRHLVSLVERRC